MKGYWVLWLIFGIWLGMGAPLPPDGWWSSAQSCIQQIGKDGEEVMPKEGQTL